MLIVTLLGLTSLIIGLAIGWPILVALSIIFVIVQVIMTIAKYAVKYNDDRLIERSKDTKKATKDLLFAIFINLFDKRLLLAL